MMALIVRKISWVTMLTASGLVLVLSLPAVAASPCGSSERSPQSSVVAISDKESPALEDGHEGELSSPAHREQETPKWEVHVGTFLPAFTTKLRAEARVSDQTLGGTIDLEGDLGLDDSQNIFRIDSRYHVSRKRAIEFTYYRFDRSARAVLERDIEFEDTVFPEGAGIVANSDTTFYILRYTQLIHQTERSAVRGGIGFHYMEFAADVATTEGATLAESASVSAPLPTLALSGTYTLGPQWRLGWEISGLSLSIGDYSGLWLDMGGTIEYFPRKDLAIGLGLSAFQVDVDADGDDLLGRLEYRHIGPRVFGTVKF